MSLDSLQVEQNLRLFPILNNPEFGGMKDCRMLGRSWLPTPRGPQVVCSSYFPLSLVTQGPKPSLTE